MKSVVLPLNDSPDASTASLTRQIYDRLRNDILSGTLAPGKKLPIEELKDSYGIGASALREALSLLTSDALVERIDHRGFRVAPVSGTGFEQLLNTRCWLEERALRESIHNGDIRWEESVVVANFHLNRVRRMQSTDRLLQSDEWEVRHHALHRAFIGACQSTLLIRFCDQMYDLNIRYRRIAGPEVDETRDVDAEHAAITDAVIARDEDRSVKLLLAHYARTADDVRKRLR